MVLSTYKTSTFQQMHLASNGSLSIKASWCSVTKPSSITRVQLWTTRALWYLMMTFKRWASFPSSKMKHRPTTNNLHNPNENRKLNNENQRREHRTTPDNAAMRVIVYQQRQRSMKANRKTKCWPKLRWVQFNRTIWSFQSQLQRTSPLQLKTRWEWVPPAKKYSLFTASSTETH